MTTQWPPRIGRDGVHRGVYLPNGRESAGNDLRVGDMVLIYESKTGRTKIIRRPGGVEERLPCQVGREGIVTVARVSAEIEEVEKSEPEEYSNGTKIWWRWKAETTDHSHVGFVSASEVKRALGYKPLYNFRGFGDGHSGLRKLSKEQYDSLVDQFRISVPQPDGAEEGEEPPPGRKFEGGVGESESHRRLKEYVANNPSDVLGEDGVELIKMEYPFCTGDRADVVLRDQAGRIIGVEVELEQSDGQREGILQAIKYRHMLAVMFMVRFEETRALLVAHKLSKQLRDLCEDYGVECREVNRNIP